MKNVWKPECPPMRCAYKNLKMYTTALRIWVEDIANLDGLYNATANIFLSCQTHDPSVAVRVHALRADFRANYPIRDTVSNPPETLENFLIRARQYVLAHLVDLIDEVRKVIDPNQEHNLISSLIWNIQKIMVSQGLSLRETLESFKLLINVGSTLKIKVVFSDEMLAHRFWLCIPNDIAHLASTKEDKIFPGINLNAQNQPQHVKVRYSFEYQKSFLDEIFTRNGANTTHNRLEWLASINQGQLTFYRGKQEKVVAIKEDETIRYASADFDDLARTTANLIKEADVENMSTESVNLLRNLQKNATWKLKKTKKKENPSESSNKQSDPKKGGNDEKRGNHFQGKGGKKGEVKQKIIARLAEALKSEVGKNKTKDNAKKEKAKLCESKEVDDKFFENALEELLTFDDDDGTENTRVLRTEEIPDDSSTVLQWRKKEKVL